MKRRCLTWKGKTKPLSVSIARCLRTSDLSVGVSSESRPDEAAMAGHAAAPRGGERSKAGRWLLAGPEIAIADRRAKPAC